MKIFVKSIFITSIIGLMSVSLNVLAQDKTIDGVVVSKNKTNNTIVVQGDVSGKRHSYFIENSTKLMSQGKPIGFADIKRGQKVSLSFRQTDAGRELNVFRVPNLEDIIDIIPVEIDEELTISGTVTGVRPIRRTITIRGEDSNEKLTLRIPLGTKITRNGEAVAITKLIKGDRATFRYNITEEGYMIISGRAPKTAPVAAEEVVPMLPKTASNRFAWLFGAFGLFLVAGLVNVARRRAVV